MNVTHHQIAVLNRVIHLAKLRAVALKLFSWQQGRNGRIRAGEVASAVAEQVEIENSPAFRADLASALKALGWRDIRTENVRYWKGVRRK